MSGILTAVPGGGGGGDVVTVAQDAAKSVSTARPMAERMRDCRHIWCAAWGVHRTTGMAMITALCCDEATVVLCSGLRGQGFEVAWLYTDELRHGRIEPEVLSGGEPPDLILYDLEEPVDESLLLLTLFRSLPDMETCPSSCCAPRRPRCRRSTVPVSWRCSRGRAKRHWRGRSSTPRCVTARASTKRPDRAQSAQKRHSIRLTRPSRKKNSTESGKPSASG